MAGERGSIVSSVFFWIFIALLILWFLGWLAFHIVAGLWHLILVIAILALILHFVRRHRTSRM
jgi:hypothetical protein